jgi:hypothetical protein
MLARNAPPGVEVRDALEVVQSRLVGEGSSS